MPYLTNEYKLKQKEVTCLRSHSKYVVEWGSDTWHASSSNININIFLSLRACSIEAQCRAFWGRFTAALLGSL